MNTVKSVILHVEDSPDDVLFTKRAFAMVAPLLPLRVARDGEEAVDYLEGRSGFEDRSKYPLPSLMLLDLKLPKKSGLEVLEWIRNESALKEMDVIVLTSSREARDVERAYELGVKAYHVKPVDSHALSALLKPIAMEWLKASSAIAVGRT